MSLAEETLVTGYQYIIRDERGVAVIAGTGIKVIELVLDATAYGWSPEELRFQHPDLSLGQIHSALGYYADHQPELDAEIERRLARVEQWRAAQAARGESPLVARLKAKGLVS